MASVFVDFSGDAISRLQKIIYFVDRPDDVLDEIGAWLDKDTVLRFTKEQAPDGSRWEQSEAARTGKGRNPEKPGLTLTDSRDLADSVTHNVENGELEHGLGEDYAAIHHYGGRTGRNHAVNLPARPIIGIEAVQAKEINDIISDWLV
ncbi:phage virion morphogenesis protein [Pseudoalteromonas sp. T1lg10]|uniref:phage virion morphogenesis protein n=1 Tax=Pseudoalteromonas sp. T1lg10 TaxID=2077093 RepID=UPI000CF6A402|nr:phage virion morphogenesis protein [Pseudoalteromonas sp. T1lg10]